MKSLVSIIVPVYKVPEQFLSKCIESIINQTLKEIEIILVDDGSPDDCGKICDQFAKKDQRVKVIHKANGGLSSARNSGFCISKGDWIMFVDGDDWIEPNMCENMYQVGKERDVQLVMCGMIKEYEHSTTAYKYFLEEKIYSGVECKILQQQLLMYNSNLSTPVSKLIKRDLLILNNVFHDEGLRQGAEGLEFNLRLFEVLESATFINKPFYHYIYNVDSISASHDEKNHEMVVNCFEKIKEFINCSKNKELLKPWFDNRLLYVIITTAISGYFNSSNEEPYLEKKRKYEEYLKKSIISEALKTKNLQGLSFQRKVILIMIKGKMFWLLNIMGKIRKMQKKRK